jgi:branched-chain amino acid aminotransferase
MIGFKRSKYCPVDEICIPGDCIGANRGYGAFDFFGVINKKPFYLDRHLDRFFNTMSLMRLKIPYSRDQLQSIIEKVVIQSELNNFYIKLFAYPMDNFLGIEIQAELFVIPVIVHIESTYNYQNGEKIITKEYQRFLPEAKSTNYLPLVYWQNEIEVAGAIDVLYHSEACVRETSRGNVFVVKAGKVFTPHEKILKGISRSVIIDILRSDNIPFAEQAISLEDLYSADEVFLSSTNKKVLPISQIDNISIGRNNIEPISIFLLKAFEKLQKEWS